MKPTKQVIVIRKDLGMRRGKECAQAAHAAMAFLTKYHPRNLTQAQKEWMENSFTKVCLQVNSEEELATIHASALLARLESHLITDAGKTEFNGIPTNTCIAIGPDYSENIDKVTGHLKLY